MNANEARKYLIDISYALGNMSIEYLTEKDGDKMREAIETLCQEPCEDAISRQAVLDVLDKSKYSNEFCKEHHIDQSINLGMAHIVVNELEPVVQQPKTGHWIPVRERLPKADEYIGDVAKYYLVQNEYGDMLVARYTHSQYWEQMYQHKPYADEIVAWRPLPAPYKKVSVRNER